MALFLGWPSISLESTNICKPGPGAHLTLCSPHSYRDGGGMGVTLNDEASLFFSSRQSLMRHRSQRDTLNTVWQTLARLLGTAGLTSKGCIWPPIPGSSLCPPRPLPSLEELGDPCLSASPSFLCWNSLSFSVPLTLTLQITGRPACCALCPALIILVL